MTEAREKCAWLEETEAETFLRFVEYLYTGEYTVPQPEILLGSSDIASDQGSDENRRSIVAVDHITEERNERIPCDEDDESSPSEVKLVIKKKKKGKAALMEKRKNSIPWMDFGEEPVPDSWNGQRKRDTLWDMFTKQATVMKRDPWKPCENTDPCECYEKVFLCHADLYAFSDKYEIELLAQLTLQKLRLTLSRFTLHPARVGDVIELIRFTYANTADHSWGIDKLRNLVMEYAVCHVDLIASNSEFGEMLQKPGALADDLVRKMLRRLD